MLSAHDSALPCFSHREQRLIFSFFYQLENSKGKALTGNGYGVEEHLWSDKAAHHHMFIGKNSEGRFVTVVSGRIEDGVGFSKSAPGNGSYKVYQTFTVRYRGVNYNLKTEFEHETVVDKKRYVNDVVVKP